MVVPAASDVNHFVASRLIARLQTYMKQKYTDTTIRTLSNGLKITQTFHESPSSSPTSPMYSAHLVHVQSNWLSAALRKSSSLLATPSSLVENDDFEIGRAHV